MAIELQTKAPFRPPVVDRLSVRVVVDSVYDRFIWDSTHPVVKIEHTREIPGRNRSTLAGEWGLSLHLESEKAGAKARYLLDFGYTPEVLNRNVDLLGIDTAKLDGLILSHGHRDHYGGLEGFVTHHRPHMHDRITLYTGGAGNFAERWQPRRGGDPESWGALDRAALEAQMVGIVCCDSACALHGPFTTGQVPRVSFERVLPNTLVRPPETKYEHFSEQERQGKLIHDEHPDEHGTCYVVQGLGLVVIASCGHCGLINTIKAAMAVSNVQKLHAVLGGFHLGRAPQDYIDHTIAEIKALDPDVVIPMHCTGNTFIAKMRDVMPERLVTSNIGTRFTFGA